MPVAPSFQDLLTQGQAEAQARRPDLTFTDGDITQAQLHGAAAMADAVIRFGAQAFKATFIDGATGNELTALVDDHLNLQREAASSSQVAVEFTRPFDAGAEPAGAIPSGTTVATEFDAEGNEIQFTTDTNLVFGLGVLGPLSVIATAVEAGRDSNVVANKVTRVLDTPGFDPTFTCNNPAAGGGGNDEETDDDLRTRARQFFTTLRRGTLAALEFGAKLVPEIRVALAVENITTGEVTVRVTDADGNSTLQMVADAIAELENWRCAGSTVLVVGGTQLLVDMQITLTTRAGFDVVPLATTFAAAVEARITKLKVGQIMYLDSIIGVLVAVAPDDVYEVAFDSITLTPGGAQPIQDVAPTTSQVVRAGTITVLGA